MKIWCLMPTGEPRVRFFPPELQTALAALGSVTWNPTAAQYTAEQVAAYINDYDVAITGWNSPAIYGRMLTPDTKLKAIIHTAGTIVPFVDAATFAAGVQVASANDLFARSVAEGVVAYMLAALRDIPYYNAAVHAGRWRPEQFTNAGLYHKAIGLVGFGAITKHLIPLLQSFTSDIRVFSHHPDSAAYAALHVRAASLDEIFSDCDIVSLHSALNPQNVHMIGADLLNALHPGALFVNTARAGLVDEAALLARLQQGDIKAALDVFDQEPLPADHPYRDLANVLLIPHMAGPTTDWYPEIGKHTIQQIKRLQAGLPLLDGYDATALKRMTRPL
ncbi:hydroxyacid dehydrogenase [Lacticaseibacillus jixiensis]|uniref:hydroxyacid dehydrogenase n=1 Tax=Lacticaseibacillus jixiensis TaxID=3231926 RepID=UPI0036F1FC0E